MNLACIDAWIITLVRPVQETVTVWSQSYNTETSTKSCELLEKLLSSRQDIAV